MNTRTTCWLVFAAGELVLVAGCPSNYSNLGATQGGVQDMGLARQLVADGRVPPPEAFVVEGMFSEHDLGLTGRACERVLCLRTALGVAPTHHGEPSAWLQIGMSSTIDPETYQRPDVTLIAVVDVSGSMGWSYATEQNEYPTPGEISRSLLRAIASQLGASDGIALVTYGSTVAVPLEVTSGVEQGQIHEVIDSLATGGSTNMEAGLRQGYELARQVQNDQSSQVRLMLLTDVQPNVGATMGSEFEELAAEGAEDGIGLTVMAVGVGLGQSVLRAMAHVRGGNAFSLFTQDDVAGLMQQDWPYLLSPIAYNMSVHITPDDNFEVVESYGFPSGTDQEVQMDVATVFLSRRRGALLVRFAPLEADVHTFRIGGTIEYETPEGKLEEQLVEAALPTDLQKGVDYFEQESLAKAVALALLVSGMGDAAEQYQENRESGIRTMKTAVERFAADIERFQDDDLLAELDFCNRLLQLMQQEAEQGDLYGYGY